MPFAEVADRWWVVAILLVGSLPGAWLGAASETRMPTATLYRVLGGLMAATAVLFTLPGGSPRGAAHHAVLTRSVREVTAGGSSPARPSVRRCGARD